MHFSRNTDLVQLVATNEFVNHEKKKKAFTEQYSNFSDFEEKTVAYVQKCQMQITKKLSQSWKKKNSPFFKWFFNNVTLQKSDNHNGLNFGTSSWYIHTFHR